MGLALVKLTQTDFIRKAKASSRAQLLVIPYSHFCELAIWSLQIAGMDSEIHGYAPGQHILPVLALRKGGNSQHLPSSSHVQPVNVVPASDKTGAASGGMPAKEEGGGSTSVPVLVMPDGRVLRDSWEIVMECGLPPIDSVVQLIYDRELGPLTRQIAYSFLLKPTNANVWEGLCTGGYDATWRCIWGSGFGGQVVRFISLFILPFKQTSLAYPRLSFQVTKQLRSTFAADDAAATSSCRTRLEGIFATLGERVRARRGRYLAGDSIGAEDVALAVSRPSRTTDAPSPNNALTHIPRPSSLPPGRSRAARAAAVLPVNAPLAVPCRARGNGGGGGRRWRHRF